MIKLEIMDEGYGWGVWGLILNMVEPDMDLRPMWEQVDENYAHGGGWRDVEGFTIGGNDKQFTLQYTGDPTMCEISRITRGDETLSIFPHSWVLWRKGDAHKVARID